MSQTKNRPFALPAHVVAVAIVPLVTEVYEKVRPRLVLWVAKRQYDKFIRDIENHTRKHAPH